jgi:mandelate racemase
MNVERSATMPASPLTLRTIRTRAVGAPMKRPLRTSVGTVTTAPLVLIDLETEEGVTGHSYLFAYRPSVSGPLQGLIAEMAGRLRGVRVAPVEIQRVAATPYQLVGVRGLVGMALSGIDVACWDVLAKAAGVPLATLLGGQPSPIPAYNSNGLGIMPAGEAADEALELIDEGFPAVKLRLGYPTLEADVATVREIRKRIPGSAMLMSDYNHSLSVAEALRRGRALDAEGLYWVEEPTAHDDFRGNARIAAALATPVQLGENFTSVPEMATAIMAGAGDYVMPDLERIGGVTGWMKAAGLAEGAGVEMSSHLFAEVSAHLLAVTPTCHWIEYVDWADAILAEPMVPRDGCLVASDQPGVGLAWNEDAVRHYLAE